MKATTKATTKATRKSTGKPTGKSTKIMGNVLSELRSLPPGVFKSAVVIATELVQIDEAGFNPSQYYDRVSFKQKYFPTANKSETEVAKNVFKMIFGGPTPIDPSKPLPPCDPSDLQILLSGLTQRFKTLANDIDEIEQIEKDSEKLRTKIGQLETLKIFIHNLKLAEKKDTCQTYNPDGSPAGLGVEDTALNELMKTYIRRFTYAVLQNEHPVPSYTAKDTLTSTYTSGKEELSHTVIDALKDAPIQTKEDLEAYVKEWEETTGQTLPPIIAEVVDRTEALTGLVNTMVADQKSKFLSAMTTRLKGAIQRGGGTSVPGQSSIESTLSSILGTETDDGDKALKLVTSVADKLKQCEEKSGKCDSERTRNLKAIQGLDARLQESLNTISMKNTELQNMTRQYIDTQAKLSMAAASDMEAKTKMELLTQSYMNQLETVQKNNQEILSEKQELDATLQLLRNDSIESEQRAADAKIALISLQELYNTVKAELLKAKDSQYELSEGLSAQEKKIADTIAQLELVKQEKEALALAQKGGAWPSFLPSFGIGTGIGTGIGSTVTVAPTVQQIPGVAQTLITGTPVGMGEPSPTIVGNGNQARLQAQVDSLGRQIALAKVGSSEITDLKQKLVEIQSKQADLAKQSAEKDAAMADLKAKIAATSVEGTAATSSLQSQLSTLQTNRDAIQQEVIATKSAKQSVEADLNQKLKAVKTQLEVTKRAQIKSQETVSSQKSTISELKNLLELATNNLKILTDAAIIQNKDVAENAAAIASVAAIDAKNAHTVGDANTTQVKLSIANEHVNLANAAIDALRKLEDITDENSDYTKAIKFLDEEAKKSDIATATLESVSSNTPAFVPDCRPVADKERDDDMREKGVRRTPDYTDPAALVTPAVTPALPPPMPDTLPSTMPDTLPSTTPGTLPYAIPGILPSPSPIPGRIPSPIPGRTPSPIPGRTPPPIPGRTPSPSPIPSRAPSPVSPSASKGGIAKPLGTTALTIANILQQIKKGTSALPENIARVVISNYNKDIDVKTAPIIKFIQEYQSSYDFFKSPTITTLSNSNPKEYDSASITAYTAIWNDIWTAIKPKKNIGVTKPPYTKSMYFLKDFIYKLFRAYIKQYGTDFKELEKLFDTYIGNIKVGPSLASQTPIFTLLKITPGKLIIYANDPSSKPSMPI